MRMNAMGSIKRRKCLFVGGCADGDRTVTSGDPWVRVPKYAALLPVTRSHELFSIDDDSELYERHILHCDGDAFLIYCPKGWTDRQAIEALLDAYSAQPIAQPTR